MRRLVGLCIFVTSMGACQAQETGAWMYGSGYRWTALNHRLSFLEFSVSESEVTMGVIGGTSTTGLVTTLPEGCVFSDCQELPVKDTSSAWIHWGRVHTRKAVFARGSALFDVGQQSETQRVSMSFEQRTRKHVAVVITGISWNMNAELSGGPSCYDPANGWHPREMTIELGAPNLESQRVELDVSGVFEAGESLESIRKCIDAVNDQARVELRVDLLAVSADDESVSQDISQGATYGFGSKTNPDPQDDPDWLTRPLELPVEGHVLGWSSIGYRFHEEDPEHRGAYLRSVAFDLDDELSSAYGHATSFSPGSQLTGFDYSFEGRAVAIPVNGDHEEGTVELLLDASVDENRKPILMVSEI